MPTFLKIRKEETAEDITLDEAEVMTMTEAAKALGITLPTLSKAITLGRFTEIIDLTSPRHQRRRLLLRKEVEEAVGKR